MRSADWPGAGDGNGNGAAALLAAFAVHNAEEIAFLGKLPPFDVRRLQRMGITPQVYRRDRMAIATGLLSAVVTAMTRCGGGTKGSSAQFWDVAATGALAGNAVGHLTAAAITRKYNPGLITAPLLLFGAIRHLRQTSTAGTLRPPAVVAGVAAGNVLSIPAIVASLLIAQRITPGESSSQ